MPCWRNLFVLWVHKHSRHFLLRVFKVVLHDFRFLATSSSFTCHDMRWGSSPILFMSTRRGWRAWDFCHCLAWIQEPTEVLVLLRGWFALLLLLMEPFVNFTLYRRKSWLLLVALELKGYYSHWVLTDGATSEP